MKNAAEVSCNPVLQHLDARTHQNYLNVVDSMGHVEFDRTGMVSGKVSYMASAQWVCMAVQ